MQEELHARGASGTGSFGHGGISNDPQEATLNKKDVEQKRR